MSVLQTIIGSNRDNMDTQGGKPGTVIGDTEEQSKDIVPNSSEKAGQNNEMKDEANGTVDETKDATESNKINPTKADPDASMKEKRQMSTEKEEDTQETEEAEEFAVDLDLTGKDGGRNPKYSRVKTLVQIRQREVSQSQFVNYSSPDLRKSALDCKGMHTTRQVTSSLFLTNKRNNKVAAVVAQPRSFLEPEADEQELKEPSNTADTVQLPAEEPDNRREDKTESDKVNPSPAGSTSGVVVMTALSQSAEEDDELTDMPPVQRRMSLNPRLMCPPGLDILKNKGMLIVRQRMDADIVEGCGAPNSFMIWDINDQQLFFGGEDSSCFCRWVCGPNRQFAMELFSMTEDFVFSFRRSCCRCDCCCCLDCFMCLQKLYVVDCLGRTMGAIKQKFGVFSAKFEIVDHDNNVVFQVIGPCCPCRCCTEIYFRVLDKTGQRQVGRIQKKWGGERLDNVNVDHEYFDITFPRRLDLVDKALIIAAGFLVNSMYFEMS